jgi:hypothetical protein
MMKKILFAVLCLPIVMFARKNDEGNHNPNKLLTTITSDTINGSFLKIQITYDQLNRVVSILQTRNRLSKSQKSSLAKPQVHKVLSQDFEYVGNNMLPNFRRRATYTYDGAQAKDVVNEFENQYFKYLDGKRVGDSIFCNFRCDTCTNASLVEYSKTDSEVNRTFEVAVDYRFYSGSYTYNTNILYNRNVAKADFTMHLRNNDGFGYHYTYGKFDNAKNPLKNLNIAKVLSSELFDFANEEEDPEGQPINKWNPPCMPINYLGWGYLNVNNPVSYTKRGNDGSYRDECPLKNISTITYTYNQFKLPVKCVTLRKTINLRRPNNDNVEGINKRSFYFAYKDAIN